jgi:hypothetical protein
MHESAPLAPRHEKEEYEEPQKARTTPREVEGRLIGTA